MQLGDFMKKDTYENRKAIISGHEGLAEHRTLFGAIKLCDTVLVDKCYYSLSKPRECITSFECNVIYGLRGTRV